MNKAVLSGILSIIAGTFGVLRLLLELFSNYWFNNISAMGLSSTYGYSPAFMQFFLTLGLIWGIIVAVTGILAIIGGIFAIKKRLWALAFAGAIAGTVAFFPCGVPAIIFLALDKDEFSAAGKH